MEKTAFWPIFTFGASASEISARTSMRSIRPRMAMVGADCTALTFCPSCVGDEQHRSVDRRGDAGVAEVDARAVDLDLRLLDLGGERVDLRAGRLDRLLRRLPRIARGRLLGERLLFALERPRVVSERRLLLPLLGADVVERRFGGFEVVLLRQIVDLGDEIAGGDALADRRRSSW